MVMRNFWDRARRLRSVIVLGVAVGVWSGWAPCVNGQTATDRQLRMQMGRYGVTVLDAGAFGSQAQVGLGQALFFDKVLSGNRDIACATCHHPSFATGDGLTLSIGTLGAGLGPVRQRHATRPFIPRNAPEVFNRGSLLWRTQFWDGRVERRADGTIASPAGPQLPAMLSHPLAVQAMFPVTSRDEMRGVAGDPGNELARIPDTELTAIWQTLMSRLLAIPEYRQRFAAAYPGTAVGSLNFGHAAEAMAAFQATAFAAVDSPFDNYLAGRDSALTAREKRGATLFFGKARCATCHNGPLLTDQQFYDIAAPQFGPGKPPNQPLDAGRYPQTLLSWDRFAFRTPPLRNVALTGPWMHNGAYSDLADAVRHHLNAKSALLHYNAAQIPAELRVTVRRELPVLQELMQRLAPVLVNPIALTPGEFADLLAFLQALTSPSSRDLTRWIPDQVPSGLPVDRVPAP